MTCRTISGLLLAVLLAAVPQARAATAAAPAAGPAAIAAQPAAAQPVDAPKRTEAGLHPSIVYGDQVLSEDTVWRGEVLVEGVLVVAPQATLTVEPGSVVRFRRRGAQSPLLVVEGRIVATGTRENPILFTSSYAASAAGDWQGIMLLGSEKKNILENLRVEGAETGIDALYSSLSLKAVRSERCGTGMRFQDALVSLEGGGALECGTGLRLTDSEATLRGLNVTGNRQGLNALRSSVYLVDSSLSGNAAAGLFADSCRIKVQGCVLSANGSGATILSGEGSISSSRLVKNREFGLSLAGARVKVSGNVISANGNNGVVVADGSAAAWDNAIFGNAGYDLYHSGFEEFRAPANWWGGGQPKVYDNGGRGRVLYAPMLNARPQSR